MADNTDKEVQLTDRPTNPARREFLKKAAVGISAAGLSVAAAETASKTAEAGGGEIKKVEWLPDIDFEPLKIDGDPITDTLANGPKGYWFHAENGQKLRIKVYPIGSPDLNVAYNFYDEDGYEISYQKRSQTPIDRSRNIARKGDHFLLLRAAEGSQPSKYFRVSVSDELENSPQTVFIQWPGENQAPMRIPDEVPKQIYHGNVALLIDFNRQKIEGDLSKKDVAIYVRENGEGADETIDSWINSHPASRIGASVKIIDNQRIQIAPIVPKEKQEPNSSENWFPSNSEVIIIISDPMTQSRDYIYQFSILPRRPS